MLAKITLKESIKTENLWDNWDEITGDITFGPKYFQIWGNTNTQPNVMAHTKLPYSLVKTIEFL